MFRSTDSGQNWQQINNGLLALYESVPLITNGYIFVGADFVGGVFRSTDMAAAGRRLTMVWTAATFGLSRSFRSELSLPEQQDAELACIAPLTTATVGRLPT
jgi:hypothetical protein